MIRLRPFSGKEACSLLFLEVNSFMFFILKIWSSISIQIWKQIGMLSLLNFSLFHTAFWKLCADSITLHHYQVKCYPFSTCSHILTHLLQNTLKTLLQNEKLVIMGNCSFNHNVFQLYTVIIRSFLEIFNRIVFNLVVCCFLAV